MRTRIGSHDEMTLLAYLFVMRRFRAALALEGPKAAATWPLFLAAVPSQREANQWLMEFSRLKIHESKERLDNSILFTLLREKVGFLVAAVSTGEKVNKKRKGCYSGARIF